MLYGQAFDTLEFIARNIRALQLCFGGIQLIVSGDFNQLPPVTDLNSEKTCDNAEDSKYCFLSKSWNRCIDCHLRLTTIHRQKEPELLTLLSEIKKGGELNATAHCLLNVVKSSDKSNIDLQTVYLYPRVSEVTLKNLEILKTLPGEEFVSKAHDTGSEREKLKNCPYPEKLVLKKNAKVMLLRNIRSKGLR